MKILLSITVFGLTLLPGFSQTPCTSGTAGSFSCDNYDLMAQFTNAQMSAGRSNDSWGWTDMSTCTEYAIIGLDNGTAFFDLSDPTDPIYLGKLPTHTSPSTWRDMKVYDDHVFVVSEASGHGMQVFDLTQLANVTNPPVTFSNTAHYSGFGSAHNIAINEDTGFAYAVGGGTISNGGIQAVDIQNPTSPQYAGEYTASDYCHDAQIVTYNGPDTNYAGKEILLGSNEDRVVIVDVTDKTNMSLIGEGFYSSTVYTHQSWLTEDHRYLFVSDEIDEITYGFNTRIVVFDVTDLSNPQVHTEYFGSTASTTHNGYVVGDRYYLANYSAGLRVFDISDIDNENITPDGYFDSYPDDDNASFDGAWNVYPFFKSKNIVISDGTNGFLLVKDPNADAEAHIVADNDSYGPIDGENGDPAVGNVLDNDKFNCGSAMPGDVTISIVGNIANGIVLDTSTGDLSVDPGTSGGEHSFVYQICENGLPGNCDTSMVTVTVDGAVSTSDFETGGLTLYPNPATGYFTVQSGQEPITDVSVTDMQGRRVLSVSSLGTHYQTVNIPALSKGVYFVTVNGTKVERLIVK